MADQIRRHLKLTFMAAKSTLAPGPLRFEFLTPARSGHILLIARGTIVAASETAISGRAKGKNMKSDSRYARVWVIVSMIGLVGCFFVCVKNISAWSAFRRPNLDTHSLIDDAARQQLIQYDATARNSGFPEIRDILRYEGVILDTSANELIYLGGNGPDVPGNSKYSDHYYNPLNRAGSQGGAAQAVKENFELLVDARLGGRYDVACQAAAWAAHFLADVHVPYHVCGVPFMTAFERYTLSEAESGPRQLMKHDNELGPGWGMTNDFAGAVHVFLGKSGMGEDRDGEMDWFDPWYYNGSVASILQSSHVSWEIWAYRTYTQNPNRLYRVDGDFVYHPLWENSPMDIHEEIPWESQVKQAEEFTKKVARNTRDNLADYLGNPVAAIYDGIWSVTTLWRASISALESDVRIEPSPDGTKLMIRYGIFNSAIQFAAYDVQAKITILTPQNESITDIKKITENLSPQERRTCSWAFDLPASGKDNKPGRYSFIVESVCNYDNSLPDLQYASASAEYAYEPPKTLKVEEDEGYSLEGEWGIEGHTCLRFWREGGVYLGRITLAGVDEERRHHWRMKRIARYLYQGEAPDEMFGIIRGQSKLVKSGMARVEIRLESPDRMQLKLTGMTGKAYDPISLTRIR
jgi:hypothetical protein